MPLTLLSSRLRHSMGSEKKEVGAGSCHWECLNLRYPSFQWTLLFVLMCRVGILFLFCYLALVTPISGSVKNLCYPFSDFTIHCSQESLCEQSPVVLLTGEQRFLQRPPKITTKASLLVASMPAYTSPVSLLEGLCSLCLYSGKLDFAAFCWPRAEQKYFLWKTVAKTVLEFSVLRNLAEMLSAGA